MTESDTLPGWREQKRPPALVGRFLFADYEHTRAFLDRAADLSDAEGIHPDLSFGRDHVNVTVHPTGDDGAITEADRRFATRLGELAESG